MVLSNTVTNYDAANTLLILSNIISGFGGFTKTGSGTTVFVNTNSYTGVTTILEGTLVLANIPKSSDTGEYIIDNGTKLAVSNAVTYTNTNPITVGSGTGTFENAGSGKTILAGTISKNHTVLVLVGTNIEISGQITGGTAADFDSDVILGSSGNQGADVLVTGTNNNYVGPTVITAGSRLTAGVQNALPSSTLVTLGAITDGSVINRYDLNNFNQTIAGIKDAGTTATNVITNSGGTTSTLTLNGSTNTSFGSNGGTIAGNLSLVRSGVGTTTLSGTHTYTGTTLINGGAIMLNGNHTGGGIYTVNTAGTLLGTGRTTSAVKVQTGGTIRPGNGVTPGTLTVGGLSFSTGGVLNILLGGANSSVLTTTGLTALANGTVSFTTTGTLTERRYLFLTNTSGPVLDTFQTETNVPTGYRVVYESNSVWLDGAPAPSPTPAPTPTPTPGCVAPPGGYVPYAANPNQVSVASALNTFSPAVEGSDKCTVIDELNKLTNDPSGMQQAFDAISPQIYQSLATMAFNTVNAQYQDLVEQMFGLRVAGTGFSTSGFDAVVLEGQGDGKSLKDPSKDILRPGADNHWGMFVDMNGIFAQANSGKMLPGYNAQSGGLVAGLTYKWCPSFATGIYSGYEGTYAKFGYPYSGSTVIDNAVRFGLFGTYGDPSGMGFYGDGLIGGTYHNYSVKRNIAFSGLNRSASSSPGAGELDSMIAAGYNWRKGNWAFGPVSSLQYTYFGMNSFNETGAQSLDYQGLNWNSASMIYNLGGNCAYSWQANRDLMVVPQINLSWQHEFLQNPYAINGSLGGAPVANTSSAPLRDWLYTGVGVTLEYKKNWNTAFFYNAAAGNRDLVSQNIFWSLGMKF
jgi:autotransporter-associated beta strand protein